MSWRTGSLVNELMINSKIDESLVAVDKPATLICWTDRHPATITKVFKIGSTVAVEVQMDDTKYISGSFSESQKYEYIRNTEGAKYTFRLSAKKKKGRLTWRAVAFNEVTKRWHFHDSIGLLIGHREKYYDYTF